LENNKARKVRSPIIEKILERTKGRTWPKLTEEQLQQMAEENKKYGTRDSSSLTLLRSAGFNPIAITIMMCEETFVFETDEEAKKAHEEFEKNKIHGVNIQGWWYGRNYFNETILEYRNLMYDGKKEDTPPIFWLHENVVTHDSFDLFVDEVIKCSKAKDLNFQFNYSEEIIRKNKEYFFNCWKTNKLDPYMSLVFFNSYLKNLES